MAIPEAATARDHCPVPVTSSGAIAAVKYAAYTNVTTRVVKAEFAQS